MDNTTLEKFRNMIKEFSELTDEQINLSASFSTKVNVKAGDFFSTPHNPSTSMGYLAKGILRRYVIDKDGNEVTFNFMVDNVLMSPYAAIILNKIQPAYIQALEESELYVISRDQLVEWWKTDSSWKDFLQIVTEYIFLNARKREVGLLMYDAQTRYARFLDDYSQYAERIRLKYVASYLGISPVSLSRIRKNFCK